MNDETVFTNNYFVPENCLLIGKTYEFKVEASNHAGLQSNSNLISKALKITEISNDLPEKILLKDIMIMGNDSVSLDFVPLDGNKENNISYIIAYKSENLSYWNELIVQQLPPIIINDLKENVFYVFKVAVQNSDGIGEFSDESYPVKIGGKLLLIYIFPRCL